MTSFVERLRQLRAERTARNIDPWLATLSNVHGTVNRGVEQISTQLLLAF